MLNQSNYPPKSLNEATSKIQKKSDELTAFYQFLSDKVTICTDEAKMLNIPQKHLTLYKRQFGKVGKLQSIKKHRCPHTGSWIQYLTNQFLQPSQLEIPFSQP